MNRFLLTSSSFLFAPLKSYGANHMGTVTKRQLKDGTIRYRAQVRVQREATQFIKSQKLLAKNH